MAEVAAAAMLSMGHTLRLGQKHRTVASRTMLARRHISRTNVRVLDLEQQMVMVLFAAFSSSVWTRSR